MGKTVMGSISRVT